jgi:hypothetical protein
MRLYLQKQVTAIAYERWGGLAGLQREVRRVASPFLAVSLSRFSLFATRFCFLLSSFFFHRRVLRSAENSAKCGAAEQGPGK